MAESDTLWHYTDAAGLLGILAGNPEARDPNASGPQKGRPTFRATAVEYLNDSRELLHGFKILRKQLLLPKADELDAASYRSDGTPGVANGPVNAKFLRAVCEEIKKVEKRTYDRHVPTYVTSFSEHQDALSQWRGYCGGLDGFAIGINKTMIPGDGDIKCKPVNYTNTVRSTPDLVDYMNEWMGRNFTETGGPSTEPELLANRLREVAAFATQYKHKGFAEEKEWRVIHLARESSPEYRSRGTQLIPYVTWTVPADAIVAVRVGPGPNQHENHLAAKGILHAFSYTQAAENLTVSRTPFR
ncbi:hypothetical protein Br6_04833 [Rhodococcus sp. Br-6]|nr:hypothetical protein Br6_04833 [Rhodococcus sp. Br-6]